MIKFKKALFHFLSSTKKFLINIVDIKKSAFCFLLAFLSSIFLLASGAANKSTIGYKCASYYGDIVLNNKDINNIALTVEQNSETSMPDTATELRTLYGAFGTRVTNYAGTINADKKKQISFVDYPFETNLSFVYIQAGVQVSVSKVDEKHFRAEFYPLDLMFEYYPNDPYNFYSFLYISTGQARAIVDYIHPGLFDKDIPLDKLSDNPLFINVCKEDILGKGIKLQFDGAEKNYQVTNIFYEKYYFYDTVYDTIGDFMVGYNQYPEGFNKQATYFLNEYEYQNEFYLSYIKEKYKTDDYKFFSHSIHYSGTINNDLFLSFLNSNSNILSTLLLLLSIIHILSSFFAMLKYRLFNSTFSCYFILSFLFPYFIGSIIRLITKNVSFFSPFYTMGVLISMIATAAIFIILFVVNKALLTREKL